MPSFLSFYFDTAETAHKFVSDLSVTPTGDFARSGSFEATIKNHTVTVTAKGKPEWLQTFWMTAAEQAEEYYPKHNHSCGTQIHSDDDREAVSIALACIASGAQHVHFEANDHALSRRLELEKSCDIIQKSLHKYQAKRFQNIDKSNHAQGQKLLQRQFHKHHKSGLGFWQRFSENHPKVAQGLKVTGLLLGAATLIAGTVAIGLLLPGAGLAGAAAAIPAIEAVSHLVLGEGGILLGKKALKEAQHTASPATPEPSGEPSHKKRKLK